MRTHSILLACLVVSVPASHLGMAKLYVARIQALQSIENRREPTSHEMLPRAAYRIIGDNHQMSIRPRGAFRARNNQVDVNRVDIRAVFVQFIQILLRSLFSPFFTRVGEQTPSVEQTVAETTSTTTTTVSPLLAWKRDLVLPPPTRSSKTLSVRREFAFEDALPFLNGEVDWNQRVKMKDERGKISRVVSDWLSEVAAQLTSGQSGLLEKGMGGFVRLRSPKQGTAKTLLSKLVSLRSKFSTHKTPVPEFRALGRLLGWCLVTGGKLPIKFSNLFFTKLLGQPVTIDLIQEENNDLFTSLSALLQIQDPQAFGLLEINGVAHRVTIENRASLVEQKLLDSFVGPNDSFGLVQKGFHDIIPLSKMRESPLDPVGLKALLVGEH
jgi:hypothetical protein